MQDRVSQLDFDFLQYEEEMITADDLARLTQLVSHTTTNNCKFPNPHNSCLLYVTGLTDEFNFKQERADTRGGSPPDIDIDFDTLDRTKIISWVVENWGREHVASIATHGVFKPRSILKDWFRVTEGNQDLMREITAKIPKQLHGFEPSLSDVLNGNREKHYPPHPELLTELKYAEWLSAAQRLEGMVNRTGIHPAGVVISNTPISDHIPIFMKKDKELMPDGKTQEIVKWITQYDMTEVESMGLIKFDFLGIDNLSVVKHCCRLVKERHGIDLDIWNTPDGDAKAYALMHQGMLTGVFQMETSSAAKDLIVAIKPTSITETSDISAMNRPGCMSKGKNGEPSIAETYIENKNNNRPPNDMPATVQKILAGTYWSMIYQEQVMEICARIAGFTLKEADDVRRAMGKKKVSVLSKYEKEFIRGATTVGGITELEAIKIWNEMLGFADYAFNKSHSIAYSLITYVCAWLKANYTIEFFTALMSVRSATLMPKVWAVKAPQYVKEAKLLGIEVLPPSVNTSDVGFTIVDNAIFFGLEAVSGIGQRAAMSIIRARGKQKFKNILEFVNRVHTSRITTKVFQSLTIAGAFDRMGYKRSELLEHTQEIFDYVRDHAVYLEREAEIPDSIAQYEAKTKLVEERAVLVKELQQVNKLLRLKATSDLDKIGLSMQVIDLEIKIAEYDQMDLRRKPILKSKAVPIFPELTRSKQIDVNLVELIEQAKYIGCYLQVHPTDIIYPGLPKIAEIEEGSIGKVAGVVVNCKNIITRNGKPMSFLEISDGSSSAEIVCFNNIIEKLIRNDVKIEVGDIVAVSGQIEGFDIDNPNSICKIKAGDITVYGKM
jgi:DNA-directed DNA polymerase III PolC